MGSISFGCALVAGRKRVPKPAAGSTALSTRLVGVVMVLGRSEFSVRPKQLKVTLRGVRSDCQHARRSISATHDNNRPEPRCPYLIAAFARPVVPSGKGGPQSYANIPVGAC